MKLSNEQFFAFIVTLENTPELVEFYGERTTVYHSETLKPILEFDSSSLSKKQKKIFLEYLPKPEDAPSLVMFRWWQDSVIALFPCQNEGNGCVNSYQIVGQHGGANLEMILNNSRPATPNEYEDIKKELEGIGYVLLIHGEKQ